MIDPVDHSALDHAIAAYLEDFTALGRGDRDDREVLLEHYAVPLTITTDAGVTVLTSAEDVLATLRGQLDGMRAEAYARSEELEGRTTVLNATSALRFGRFRRLRHDGSEIGRLAVTYLWVETVEGPRISAMAVHPAGTT